MQEELVNIEKNKHPGKEAGEDQSAPHGSFLDTVKQPTVIAAIISGIAIIVAALLKRKRG